MSDVELKKTNLPEPPPMGQSVLPLVDNMKPRVVTTDKENIEEILSKIEKIYEKIIHPSLDCLYCGALKSIRILHEEVNLYKEEKYFNSNVTPTICNICDCRQFLTTYLDGGDGYFKFLPFDYFTQKKNNQKGIMYIEGKPLLEEERAISAVEKKKPGRPSKVKKEEKEEKER